MKEIYSIGYDKSETLIPSLDLLRKCLLDNKTEKLRIGGINFDYYSDKNTDSDSVNFLKYPGLLIHYIDLYSKQSFSNVLEFGIYQGGSALFFSSVFDEIQKYVGVDICTFNPVVDSIVSQIGFSGKIKLYYETRQESLEILNIIDHEFEDGLDLIIDDCSHQYDYTKKSFEMTFPKLKPHGLYVIEDWGWAHTQKFQDASVFKGKTALSYLVFELIALYVTRRDYIASVNILGGDIVIFERGTAEISAPFSIEDTYLFKGKNH